MKVKIKKQNKKILTPKYQTKGASGFDFHAMQDVRIAPGETKLVPTGLAFAIPEGYELQVRPRSGTSYKTKLRIANSPGTVDSDYRGFVQIIMENIAANDAITNEPIIIKAGDRIAQGVICPIIQCDFEDVDELGTSERGSGGFGSTGSN